jgi:hypothetical protein
MVLTLIAVLLCSGQSAPRNQDGATLLSRTEAALLVYLTPPVSSFRKATGQVPFFESLESDFNCDDYYVLYVSDPRPTEGTPTIGTFAVNKHTADVTNVGPITEVEDPDLLGAQQILRAEHHIGDAVRKEFRDAPIWKQKRSSSR